MIYRNVKQTHYISNALSSHFSDDDMKSVIGYISPFACTSLWEGVIRLKTTTVSVLAFFRR